MLSFGDQSSRSRSLIEEMMIIAGRVAGLFAQQHNLPVAYRGLTTNIPHLSSKNVVPCISPELNSFPRLYHGKSLLPQADGFFNNPPPLKITIFSAFQRKMEGTFKLPPPCVGTSISLHIGNSKPISVDHHSLLAFSTYGNRRIFSPSSISTTFPTSLHVEEV